jgi:hypothetical protein
LASNLVGHETGVLDDCEMQRISFLALNGLDGRLDVAHQRLHMTWSGIAGKGSFDGTATVVTDDNDEAGAEMVHCVFDAAQSVIIDQVARSADHEKVANVVVEDEFGRGARVGAANYDCKGALRLCGFRSFGGVRFSLRHFMGGEAAVNLLEIGERGLGADRGSGGLGG